MTDESHESPLMTLTQLTTSSSSKKGIIELAGSHKVSPFNEVLYRYIGTAEHYEGGDQLFNIYLYKYPVVRKTRYCDVIDEHGHEHFVNRHGKKRFAYPTLELAANSFKIRCRWRKRYADWAMTSATEIDNLRKELLGD
jgi:hypothetical protein